MKFLTNICAFLFSLPFVILIFARLIDYLAIDVKESVIDAVEAICSSTLAQQVSENKIVGKQVVILTRNLPIAVRELLEEDKCRVFDKQDLFQGVKLVKLYDETFIDIQRSIYSIAKRCIEDHHKHLIFPLRDFSRDSASYNSLIDYYERSSSSEEKQNHFTSEIWETIATQNHSIIQAAQIYDKDNINQDDNLDNISGGMRSDNNGKAGKRCQKAYRAAILFNSDLSLQEIFFLLASWQGISLFFLTKTWQDMSYNHHKRPIFSYEWFNGTVDLLYIPIYSSPFSRKDLFTFRFVDRISQTIVFQSFYPGQLVQEHSEDYLISLITSYLKSYDQYYPMFEDRFDNKEAFYQVTIGMTIREVQTSKELALDRRYSHGFGSHSYMIELVRNSANPNYFFSVVNRQIDSNLFFSYFLHQLKRLVE